MMQISRNMFFAVFIATILALMLSFLPQTEWQSDRLTHGVPVFQNEQENQALSEANLVDVFSRFETRFPIRWIKWENGNLYVDISAPSGEDIESESVVDILYRLAKLCISNLNNVNEVNARILTFDNESSQVLVAMTAERVGDSSALAWLANESDVSEKQRYLEQNFRLYYSELWKQKIANEH